MPYNLLQIAEMLGGEVSHGTEIRITGITSIEDAGSSDITFAISRQHLDKAAKSKAAAVLVPMEVEDFPLPVIRVQDPKAAFAALLEKFTPPPNVPRVVHPTCIIGQNVTVGKNVAIQPYVVIADNAVIGDNCVLYPHVYIGEGSHIGKDTLLYPNVTVRERCSIGDRCIIHSGTVIGSDGFGFVTIDGQHRKVPQVGNVVIEDDVEIGAQVAIDRATTGTTRVGRGTKIDNLVHLAHNDQIGENCFLVAQVGIAGSVKVGNNVTLAGQAGSAGHLTIGDNSVFAAKSGIINDVPANSFYSGFPARPHKERMRSEAALMRLPELMKQVRALKQQVEYLQSKVEEKTE